MKIISRILIILVVASLVGGAMYAAVSAGGNMTQTRTRGDFDGQRSPGGEFRPDREGRPEGGVMLPFGVVKSLILTGIVAAIYFNTSKWWVKRKRQQAITANG
jgi:hypothetical protein